MTIFRRIRVRRGGGSTRVRKTIRLPRTFRWSGKACRGRSGADGLAVRTSGGGLRRPRSARSSPRECRPGRPPSPIPFRSATKPTSRVPLTNCWQRKVPDAVPPRPPPSKIVVEPDVPGFAMPVELPSAPAPEHAVAPPIAGTTGDAPDVIGLTPGDASSVAPSGIPVGATGAAGPMPSGDVMPSGDGPGDVGEPADLGGRRAAAQQRRCRHNHQQASHDRLSSSRSSTN